MDSESDIYRELCDNPTLYVSPRELFEVMLPNDGTVCFISMVEQIDSTIAVKTKNGEVQRCRVILTNNKDWKVQVTIWGNNINRVIHNFKTSFVVHVSGAFSQKRYSKSLGNVPMDLTIKDYTVVNVIGKIREYEETKIYEPVTISLEIVTFFKNCDGSPVKLIFK
ncbi:uncharacterized protein LOC114945213 [Nylanderia fulva]|uniref:uncharacterized protein LOC114945213 n=1 Tax=Nylanderia fulva TaxID=613905 RepID=UPI0010FB0D9A|nr:uncharacterized protein LOC114945213 [Nylanderia fulva]